MKLYLTVYQFSLDSTTPTRKLILYHGFLDICLV
jgi:hypothetical protein